MILMFLWCNSALPLVMKINNNDDFEDYNDCGDNYKMTKIQCLGDEMKWSEWREHCDVVLRFWLSKDTSGGISAQILLGFMKLFLKARHTQH